MTEYTTTSLMPETLTDYETLGYETVRSDKSDN